MKLVLVVHVIHICALLIRRAKSADCDHPDSAKWYAPDAYVYPHPWDPWYLCLEDTEEKIVHLRTDGTVLLKDSSNRFCRYGCLDCRTLNPLRMPLRVRRGCREVKCEKVCPCCSY